MGFLNGSVVSVTEFDVADRIFVQETQFQVGAQVVKWAQILWQTRIQASFCFFIEVFINTSDCLYQIVTFFLRVIAYIFVKESLDWTFGSGAEGLCYFRGLFNAALVVLLESDHRYIEVHLTVWGLNPTLSPGDWSLVGKWELSRNESFLTTG